MNIQGLRVLNTRPFEQGKILHQAIVDAGGISIDLPALVIEPIDDWLTKLPALDQIHQAIFISANAISCFFSLLKQHKIRWPDTIQTTAIGKASASALKTWSVRVDHIPPIADSEHLLQLPVLQKIDHQMILLIKGEEGKEDIEKTLTARGAHLIPLATYRRVLPVVSQIDINSLWQNDLVDIILFTSEQGIKNMFSFFKDDTARAWLCSKPCIVISERLAEAAFMLGMRAIIVSRYDVILNTFEQYQKNQVAFWRPSPSEQQKNNSEI